MQTGSCKFGLWRLIVSWDKTIVHQVQFVRTAPAGDVPVQFTRYLAGKSDSFAPFTSAAAAGTSTYARIYRAVAEIPYGETRTYRDIALAADTFSFPVTVLLQQTEVWEGLLQTFRSKRNFSNWKRNTKHLFEKSGRWDKPEHLSACQMMI